VNRPRALAALILLAGVTAAVTIALTGPSRAARPHRLESLLQDDNHLIYASSATVVRTLDRLRALGVQRIRATVLWRAIAPDPSALRRPRFNAADPAAYPAGNWRPYDRLVELAFARGIGVDFNLGAPGPRWAMGPGAPTAKFATHWYPNAAQFGRFVAAVGRRYSGRYRLGGGALVPRVAYWSIWNEPNQPGWLAPQWRRLGGHKVMASPVLYRSYVDAAFRALGATGHRPGRDTILVGELAPEGAESPGHTYSEPMPPLPFLRALYCVDDGYRRLRGGAAAALGCPAAGRPAGFVAAHPGLFEATGFAHHPYSFFLAPGVSMSDPNFVPLSDLGRLERALDTIFGTYGVARKLPLYLTEYGYATNPPNPYSGISLALQAAYINQGEFLAWKDRRVRALSQFLLYDSPPNTRFPRGSVRYWSTFQTGLLFAGGAPKPALAAYRLAIFIPNPVLRGGRVFLWGRVRAATRPATVQVQWRDAGAAFHTVAELGSAGASQIVSGQVRLPGAGQVRLAWTSPEGPRFLSRAEAVRGG
jgi:hypothetical protein